MSILFTITVKRADNLPKQKMKIIADSRDDMLHKLGKHFVSLGHPHWHFCHYEDICLATTADHLNSLIVK